MLLDPLDQAADAMHKLWAIRAVRAANACQTAPSPDALHGPAQPVSCCRHAATKIKRPDRHPGDQASDLHLLVAGAGFEPATSGL